MRIFQIGIATPCESADEVQRGRRLAIGLQLALRIGRTGFEIIARIIDDIATIDRQLDAVMHLGRIGTGLRELPSNATDLHDG